MNNWSSHNHSVTATSSGTWVVTGANTYTITVGAVSGSAYCMQCGQPNYLCGHTTTYGSPVYGGQCPQCLQPYGMCPGHFNIQPASPFIINPTPIPLGPWNGTSTNIFPSMFPEYLYDFSLKDILSDADVPFHEKSFSMTKKDNGMVGTITRIKLAAIYSNFFLNLGKNELSKNLWALLSPLLFKLVVHSKDGDKSHHVTVLAIDDLIEDNNEITLTDVKLVEVTDNLAVIQLLERYKNYFKRLETV